MLVSAAATLAAALSVLGGNRLVSSPLVWVLLGLLAVTLLQTLPLPFALLTQLAPRNAEIWAGARTTLGIAPDISAPLSLDPGASAIEAVKLWTYACVLTTSAALAERKHAALGALLLCGSALVLALVTLGHGLVDATRVFGVYTPRLGGKGFRVAPLINPNNLAGYLNLGFASGLGLLSTGRPPIPRWITCLALIPIVGMSVLTGSRAGLASLLLCAVGAVLWLRPSHEEPRERRRLFERFVVATAGVLAVAVTLAVVSSGSRLWHLLFEDNWSKLQLARATFPLLAEHAWLGIGRGAFESVFPGTHTAPDNSIFSHPENFLIQWVSEWGAPVTLLALLGAAWLLRRAKLRVGESRLCRGLATGVLALSAQNLFDLGFEVPGVMIALVVAVALALRRSSPGPAERRRRAAATPTRVFSAAAVLAVGLVLSSWAWSRGETTLASDRDALRAAQPTKQHDREQYAAFRTATSEAMLRHPAEPYFPRLAAFSAWRAGDNPMRLINRALERGPSEGRTHLLLGRILAAQKLRAQALLELRIAAELEPALVNRIAAATLQLTIDPEELMRAVPSGAAGASMLVALAGRLPKRMEPTARALLEEALRRNPKDARLRLRLVRRVLASLSEEGSSCAGSGRESCRLEVESQLSALGGQHDSSLDLPVLRAELALALQRPQDALHAVDGMCSRMQDRPGCITVWLRATAQTRDGAALTRVAHAIRSEICPAERGCVNLSWSAGETALALGNAELALAQFEQAAMEDDSPKRWLHVAQAAEHAGYPGRALRALDHASALAPRDPAVARQRDALRQSISRAMP